MPQSEMIPTLSSRPILTAVAVGTLFGGFYAGVSWENAHTTWASVVACFGILSFANLDRLAEFKATKDGFEAKTREVIQRAEVTLLELQTLSKQIAGATLSLLISQGRWGGIPDDEKEKIKNSMLDVLRNIGLPDSEGERLLTDSRWHLLTEYDYIHVVLGGHTVPDGVPKETMAEYRRLRNCGPGNNPTPSELRSFLETHGLLSYEAAEWVKDYEHYLQFRRHRRPERWALRKDVSRLRKQ